MWGRVEAVGAPTMRPRAPPQVRMVAAMSWETGVPVQLAVAKNCPAAFLYCTLPVVGPLALAGAGIKTRESASPTRVAVHHHPVRAVASIVPSLALVGTTTSKQSAPHICAGQIALLVVAVKTTPAEIFNDITPTSGEMSHFG